MIPFLLGCTPPGGYDQDPEITSLVDDWRDEVIYQVLTDRFANGDVNNDFNVSRDENDLARHLGGDWQGLIDHAGYFEALGVTTLWISPVVTNVEEDAGVAGYHGYWAQDFTQPNPHFGDLAKLRELVDVMHQRNIKVVVDIVANHVGQLFYYDINRNGQPDEQVWNATDGSGEQSIVSEWDPPFDSRGVQSFTSLGEAGEAPITWVDMPELNRVPPVPSEFADESWYNRKGRVTDWAVTEQVEEGDFPGGLKDLLTENPNVQQALVSVYADWITRTNIDGYRIDTVKHVDHATWQVFCPAIREHAASLGKENFFLFGEVFDGDDQLVGSYTAPGELDSLAYFSQKYQVFDEVIRDGGATSKITELWASRSTNWGTSAQEGGVGLAPVDVPVNFIDNHDVPRLLSSTDEDGFFLSLLLLFTEPGVPVLYYGTEQGFDGANDPANREPIWPTGYDTESPSFSAVAELVALRQSRPALQRGDVAVRTSGEAAGLFAFERATDDDRVLVMLNTASSVMEGDVPTGFDPGTVVSVLWPYVGTFTVASDGTLPVALDARAGLVVGS